MNFVLAGNPNVGKSTVFNSITGLRQHTGNWTGKTVDFSVGEFEYKSIKHKITDLPGTYSIYADSMEETVSKEYLENNSSDCVIIVADVNALERNLLLTIQILMKTSRAVLCLNMNDIADKNGVSVDVDELSLCLGIPVVKLTANKKKGINTLIDTAVGVAQGRIKTYCVRKYKELNSITDTLEQVSEIRSICADIAKCCIIVKSKNRKNLSLLTDRIITNKVSGTVIMVIFIAGLFWLTAVGANYPSEALRNAFMTLIKNIKDFLLTLNLNESIVSLLCDGVLTTGCWVVSVMLPPAIIFFPLFSLLEDWGYLPRVAFNLDRLFCKSGTNGKHSLTMLMGFGCNSCGVTGCRIFSNKAQRDAAIVTNSFVPCNGRIPMLITLANVFVSYSDRKLSDTVVVSLVITFMIMLSFAMTLLVSKAMTLHSQHKTQMFTLELPAYKKPHFLKTIGISMKDKVLSVLLRALAVALPAGALIWILANIRIGDSSLLHTVADAIDPIGKVFGIDGVILLGFIMGFPANEIVLPIIFMTYTSSGVLAESNSQALINELLINNNWTQLTAICAIVLCVFHFPCSTTCITIYKETKSKLLTMLSIVVPLMIGFTLCLAINLLSRIFF